MQDNYTIVGAGLTDAAQRQVAVRTVSGSAQSSSIAVNATGHNAHPALAARGSVTFFNALPTARQVNAGQTLDAGGGVQIVTDATAFIPAANAPTTGSVSVPAHATPGGVAGDIGALTFNQIACCAQNIFVSNNAALTGGQDQVDYYFLQKTDVSGAITQAQMSTVQQNALADLNKQLHVGERQTGQAQCVPTTNVDQPIGDKGSSVTTAYVTYLLKCTATFYDYQGAQNIAQNLLKEKANTDPGGGYTLVGAVQSNLSGQTNTNNVLSLFLSTKGVWVYQFSDAQKLQLARAIAGKSIAQAQSILNGTTGIGSAKIDYTGGNTLPSDPNQIALVIQTVAGLKGQGNDGTSTTSSPIVSAPTIQSGNVAGGTSN